MVSKSTSILMAIGIVAVAAVAIIGLGYAYTATTTNDGNDVDSSYLTVTQAAYSNGFEDNSVVFNTVTDGTGTTYTLAGTNVISTGAAVAGIELKGQAEAGGYFIAGTGGSVIYKLGDNAFTITKYGMSTIPAYNLKISATGLDTTHYKYFISLDNTNFYAFTGSVLTIAQSAPGTGPVALTVNLYVAQGDSAPTAPTQKPMTNTTVTVVAEVSAS